MNNKEMVEACHKVLAIARNDYYNNCHYVFCKNDNQLISLKGQLCYSALRASNISHLSLCINQHTGERFKDYPKEMKKLISYLNWIIKKSPWRNAFLYPSQSIATKLKDGVVMNTNKSPQYVVGAMSALRAAWEYPYFLDAWNKFKKLGFSKESSFILANVLDDKGEMSNPNDNHATFQINYIFKDSFSNFKEGEYKKHLSMKENASSYREIFQLFQGESQISLLSVMKPFEKVEGNGWNAKYSYPFTPEFIKALKEFVNE